MIVKESMDFQAVQVVAIRDGYEIQCDKCENYVSGFHLNEFSAQHSADLHRDWHQGR